MLSVENDHPLCITVDYCIEKKQQQQQPFILGRAHNCIRRRRCLQHLYI